MLRGAHAVVLYAVVVGVVQVYPVAGVGRVYVVAVQEHILGLCEVDAVGPAVVDVARGHCDVVGVVYLNTDVCDIVAAPRVQADVGASGEDYAVVGVAHAGGEYLGVAHVVEVYGARGVGVRGGVRGPVDVALVDHEGLSGVTYEDAVGGVSVVVVVDVYIVDDVRVAGRTVSDPAHGGGLGGELGIAVDSERGGDLGRGPGIDAGLDGRPRVHAL